MLVKVDYKEDGELNVTLSSVDDIGSLDKICAVAMARASKEVQSRDGGGKHGGHLSEGQSRGEQRKRGSLGTSKANSLPNICMAQPAEEEKVTGGHGAACGMNILP